MEEVEEDVLCKWKVNCEAGIRGRVNEEVKRKRKGRRNNARRKRRRRRRRRRWWCCQIVVRVVAIFLCFPRGVRSMYCYSMSFESLLLLRFFLCMWSCIYIFLKVKLILFKLFKKNIYVQKILR